MSNLTHVQEIRQALPSATSRLYLNSGTFGPIPTCVIQAMHKRMETEWANGRLGPDGFESIINISQQARGYVARLLHAEEQEIALTDNTGEGINVISYGLNWQEGDEVITTNHEHISALAPLYQLRDRYGIVIRIADLGPTAERPLVEAVAELVNERTRLIVVSHVTWTTGTVLDIRPLGLLGRERGIPVLIDGAQSAGAIDIDVKALEVDFYAIPMQKWLCGPDGTGALYVRREAMSYITSTYVGYHSMKHEEDVEWALHDTAQRFEVGGRQTAAIAGQCAVLNWLENTVGYEWLYQHVSQLNVYASRVLQEVPGIILLTPKPGACGIITFTLTGIDDATVVKLLRENYNIYIRNIPNIHALRLSTDFYNTEEEINILAQALKEIVGEAR